MKDLLKKLTIICGVKMKIVFKNIIKLILTIQCCTLQLGKKREIAWIAKNDKHGQYLKKTSMSELRNVC